MSFIADFLGLPFSILSSISAAVAAYYAYRSAKIAIENNDRNLERQHSYHLRGQIINLSNEWNSVEYIEARIQLDNIFSSKWKKESYLECYKNLDISDKVKVSLICHFFLRLAVAAKYEPKLSNYIQEEFLDFSDYWTLHIIPLYHQLRGEERIVRELQQLRRSFKLREVIY